MNTGNPMQALNVCNVSQKRIYGESAKYFAQKLLVLIHTLIVRFFPIWLALCGFVSMSIMDVFQIVLMTTLELTIVLALTVSLYLFSLIVIANLYFYVREKWIGLTLCSSLVEGKTDHLIRIPRVKTSAQDIKIYLLISNSASDCLFIPEVPLGNCSYIRKRVNTDTVTLCTLDINMNEIREMHLCSLDNDNSDYTGGGMYIPKEELTNTVFIKFNLKESANIKVVLYSGEMGS